MLRNEIQKRTNLTRKAIEYYEKKGFISPKKSENGYRYYSDEDLLILNKISLLRKIGIPISEIEKYINSNGISLSSTLRKKQLELYIDEKRKDIIKLIINGENEKLVKEKISTIEIEESIYEKLEKAFPDYLGQMLFSAYQPFLKEPLTKDGEFAYKKFIEYLDNLPKFELNDEEQKCIDDITYKIDMKNLKEINKFKINNINNSEQWIKDNEENILIYENYVNSEEYKNSIFKKINDKLKNYMIENNYYEIAIPLIRQFSKSYDEYYINLIKANEYYLKKMKKQI